MDSTDAPRMEVQLPTTNISTPLWLRVIHGFVLPALFIGNLMVIVAVLKFTKLRTVSNYFVFSLAIVDCLVGLASVPGIYFLRSLNVSGALCYIYFTIIFSVCFVSVLHILAINVDRYVAITRPLQYSSIVTRTKAVCAILFIWIFGSATLIVCFRSGLVAIAPNRCAPNYSPAFALLNLLGLFFVPFTTTALLYMHIYRLTVKHLRTIKSSCMTGQGGATMTPADMNKGDIQRDITPVSSVEAAIPRKETEAGGVPVSATKPGCHMATAAENLDADTKKKSTKALRVIARILCTFGIAWGLFYTAITIVAFNPLVMTQRVAAQVFYLLLELLFLSAAVNPIIYAFYSHEFKIAFRKLLCRKFTLTNSSRVSVTS